MLGMTLAVGFVGFSSGSVEASSAEVQKVSKPVQLTQEQINQRFEEINAKYNLNEPFSKKDADFVKQYANKPLLGIKGGAGNVKPQAYKSNSFTQYGGQMGLSAYISGSVFSDHGVWSNSYGANYSTYVYSGTASKVYASVSHTAYGAIGSGGIGKVYSNTLSNTTYSNYNAFNESENYYASVAYSYTTARSIIYHSGGSFTIKYPS